jgi:hypothetical protein
MVNVLFADASMLYPSVRSWKREEERMKKKKKRGGGGEGGGEENTKARFSRVENKH